MSETQSSYVVKWCGSPCAGNPHESPDAAREWIRGMWAKADASGSPKYGYYSIHDAKTDAEIPIDPRPRCQVCGSVLLNGGTYCEVCEIDW